MNAPTINTVIHGDCTHILPQLATGSADFALTDPPYLINYKSRDGRSVPGDNHDAWLRPAFAELYRVLARGGGAWSRAVVRSLIQRHLAQLAPQEAS